MADENLFEKINIEATDNGTLDDIKRKVRDVGDEVEKTQKRAQRASQKAAQSDSKRQKGQFSIVPDSQNFDPEFASFMNKLEKEIDQEKKKKRVGGTKKSFSLEEQEAERTAKASAAKIDLVTKSINKLQKSLDFTDLVFKVKALGMAFQGALNVAEAGTAIVEENNLFYNQLTNVSKDYDDLDKSATRYYERAIDYQNKLYEATHLNRVENMKSQGTFFQLFNAQGVGEELSYQLSESLANAAIDLSSLFNIDYDEMVTKLKSGIIGNSRPLRDLGIDVTEGTMQGILDNLGIEATVDQLSFAEKEVLRYMTIVEQVGFAQGDFANTFLQSANQIRVFQSELQTIGQMIGAIFNKLLSNVLTVARGIVMAVEEILTALGSLIGIDWSETGSTKPLASLGEEVDDVTAGIGGATKAAKEFKKQIMSFDEIHNITPPDTSSGGGGGGAGGISGLLNSALTDQLEQWKSNFESIDDEAKKIKDNILKTLGFTKDINGNLKWSITDFWNNIGDWGRNIIRVIQAVLAFKLGAKIVEMAGNIKKMISLLGGNVIQGSGLQVGIQMLGNTFKATRENFNQMIDDWAFGNWDKNGAATKFLTQIGGITSAIVGIVTLFQDIKSILDGTADAADMFPAILLRITQAITGIGAAIAVVQTSINPIIGIISFIISGITGIVASFVEIDAKAKSQEGTFANLKKKIDEATEARKKYNEQIQETKDNTLKEVEEESGIVNHYEKLKEELMGLVDANGKIKVGNEDRVKFILGELKKGLGVEYDLNGNIIKQYDQYISKINKAIQAKKDEIYINAFQDDYTAAIKRTTDQQKKLTDAKKNYDDIQSRDETKKAIEKYEWLKKKLAEAGYEYKETGIAADDFRNVVNAITSAEDNHGYFEGQKLDLDKLAGAYREVNFSIGGMQENLNSLSSAEAEYKNAAQAIVEDNQLIILYEDLLAAQASEDSAKIEAAKTKLSEFYKKQGETDVGTFEDQLTRQIDANNKYIEEQKRQGKEITDDRKKAMDLSVKYIADGLREQTKTVQTLTPDQVNAWKKLSENSHDIYEEEISQLDPETQTLLNTLTGKVTAEQPQYWEAWSKMAVNAKEKFKENIKSLPQDEQTTLLAGISTVKGCEQATVEAYGQLSDAGKIEYLGKIKNLPEEQRKNILEMLSEFGKQDSEAGRAAGELATTIQKAIDGEELKIGDQQVKVDGKAIDDKIKGAIGTITVPIKGDYKASWHYIPKPDGSGEYEWKYFAKGGRPTKGQIFVAREAGAELVGNIGGSTGVMNNMQIITAVAKGVSSAVANVLHSGFTVSLPQNNSVSNVQEQLVNEMRISNEYASQEIRAARPSVSSKFGFSSTSAGTGTQGLAQILAQAVEYGMSNANVNVKVEATTDTGVVVKQVSEAMNDYVNQTGQLPFAIPM